MFVPFFSLSLVATCLRASVIAYSSCPGIVCIAGGLIVKELILGCEYPRGRTLLSGVIESFPGI